MSLKKHKFMINIERMGRALGRKNRSGCIGRKPAVQIAFV